MDETLKDHDQEWPLVTFALFAYNQEKYIREAVEGALAQDYPNLEIIISDDCSQDATYEVIQDTVRNYSGAHRVIVRQSEENRGVLHHVMGVASQAKGGLLVLAAGDDLSKQERTSVLVSAWQATGAWGLCSRFDRINEAGRLLEESAISDVLEGKGFRKYFYEEDGEISIVHGCSSAYDTRLFAHVRMMPEDFILSEDGALSVLINMLGKKIAHLDDSLVGYREHSDSLTNGHTATAKSWTRLLQDEDRIAWFAKAQANRCRLFLRMDEELGGKKLRSLNPAPIQEDLNRQEMMASWWIMSVRERVKCLPTFLKHGDAKWAFARLPGKAPFLWLKWLHSQVAHAHFVSRDERRA